jgi:hypothetical protein
VLATLAGIGEHHSVVITAIKSDHSEYTVDGNVSNHSVGRAFDIVPSTARSGAAPAPAAAPTWCTSSRPSAVRCARFG